jgi:small subunit ribosomal protein S3
MGQKVSPTGLRLGINKGWSAQWYADKKDFGKHLKEDYEIRTFLKKKYYAAGITRIIIERSAQKVTVTVWTGKPGILIGKAGAGIAEMKKETEKLLKGKTVNFNVMEIKRPDMDATLIAESIAQQLEKRIFFRRAMKQAQQRAMRAGAKGVKTMVAGRLDGAEIARTEHYHEGSIPLQTLRADIDYGVAEAHTTFGVIGVKVWVYKGEVLGKLKSLTGSEGGNN